MMMRFLLLLLLVFCLHFKVHPTIIPQQNTCCLGLFFFRSLYLCSLVFLFFSRFLVGILKLFISYCILFNFLWIFIQNQLLVLRKFYFICSSCFLYTLSLSLALPLLFGENHITTKTIVWHCLFLSSG